MKRIDLKITFKCNNQCQFCVQGSKRKKFGDKNLKKVTDFLTGAWQDGYRQVVFTGGEPTLHPDFLRMVKKTKQIGFFIQIQTNGRTFAYKNFCRQLVELGVDEFGPSIHGAKAQTHDFLTSSLGSFRQTVTGIKNLKELGQYVLTNTVITTKNYQELSTLAKLLVDLGVDQFQLAFVHILGSAKKNQGWLVPKKTTVMPYVKKALDIGVAAKKTVMTEAIPYCLMRGYEKHIAENIIPEAKILDAGFVVESYTDYRQNQGKMKGPKCKSCRYFNICEGPWREYPAIFGWDEFKPIKK